MKRRFAILIAVAAVAVGCNYTSGTELKLPPNGIPPQDTAPIESIPTLVVGSSGFAITYPLVDPGAQVLIDQTSRGLGNLPPVEWTSVPQGTQEITLVIRNADDSDRLHLVAAGIPPDAIGLIGSSLPASVVVFPNEDGVADYLPMDAVGGMTNRFVITAYALDAPLAVVDTTSGAVALDAIENLAIDSTSIMVRDTNV